MPKRESIEVIARAVLLRDSTVLLCQASGGYFYLPGGHVEFGEPASIALERELVEECGLVVRSRDLILVSEGTFRTGRRKHHEINLVFHVEHPGKLPATVRSREPDIAFCWHPLRSLGDVDVRPAPVRDWVSAWDQRGPKRGAAWLSAFSRSRK